ncbi:translocation/assembly module TamB domain-containing protein, partial [Bdellovibrionota bacterium FG-2]
SYLGKGFLDLGDAETAALDFSITEGNVQDLIQIFRNLVKDYWWFPHSLNGPFSGKVHVGGGLDLKLLDVTALFNGEAWDFMGERFRTVALQGGYERGRVYITSLKSKKRTGEIQGRISVDPQDFFDWSLVTRGFSVSDLDHVAQLDVPMRGALSFFSEGKGKLGVIQSNTQIALNQVVVRGQSLPPSELVVRSEHGVTRAQGTALGGQGGLDFSYDFNLGGQSFLRTELKGLDFSPLLLLLNPRMMQDPELAGSVSAAAQLSFRSGQIEKGSGKIEIQDYLLAKKGARFHLAHPVSFKVTEGAFDLHDLVLKGTDGSARLDLRGRESEIEGRVTGGMDVSVVEFLTPSISQAAGVAELDFTIGGALKDPLIFGRATVEGVSVRVPAVDSPFENISGTFQLRQNLLTVQNLKADLAGGRVDAEGTVQLFADRYPKVSLFGRIAQTKLKIVPFDFVTLKGKLEVQGDEPPYKVKGEVVSDSALSTMKVLQSQKVVGLKALQYTPPPSLKREGSYPKFVLEIQASADRGIMIRNDLIQAEAKGAVTIVNTLETPRIIGKAELIQGKMVFKDRMFQIESASAIFDNPMEINPILSLLAHTELSPYKIQLYVSGRMDPLPKIELTSNPVMPESEIISLLTMGLTSGESKRLSSADRSLMEQGEAASLLLHSLDFNREVQSKTGFEIQLNESVNPQQATSAFRPQSTEGSVAPKVVIKKSLTKNLDVSAGSTVGVGTSGQKEVNAEYKVTPGVFVIGVWDQFETNDANSNASFGFDLKLQKRFK